ncbi:glycosyltransferase [Spirosoma utsteinense]|uniref:Sugar transferase n=1 Tax=Spirosoma utsteinense TaxID=2585773 RepID=A0ABR6WEP6_9BACT|nr:glycosyltransferase [Spirosoma utsteinense]MBC3788255.1 hypothetical protein [Spirosoma utsteinense]MBC3794668.1 hypothetical protein [Spirosoma utsteinense]
MEALRRNHLADVSKLYVFVDGPKGIADVQRVDQVKLLIDKLSNFQSIERHYSSINRGLATSVISGVTQVLSNHPSAIILEDDLITAPSFLKYMNACINLYADEKTVASVSGYTFPFPVLQNYAYDAYFFPRYSSWGWATWADRWRLADWQVSDFDQFMLDKQAQHEFSKGGTDLVGMLKKQMNGELDSWAIRWGYSQFKQKSYTVYPTRSKVNNIGFDEDATHTTNVFNRYKTVLDDQSDKVFSLPPVGLISDYYLNVFRKKYSKSTRIFNRMKTLIGMR